MAFKFARKKVLSPAAAFVMCGLAFSAYADLPAALDRVPADAVVAVSLKDLAKIQTQFKKLVDATGMKADLSTADQLLATPGVNKNGSAAIVLMPGAAKDKEGPGPMVIVVPVSDYAAFVKAFGGSGSDKIAALTMPEEMGVGGEAHQVFAKDLGGGYAAMGPAKDVIEGFDGAAGKSAGHKKALGAVGGRVADANDTVVVANIEKLAPMIEQGVKSMKDQLGMMMAMGGAQADQAQTGMKVIEAISQAVIRDATVAVAGLGFDEKGVTFDMGAQFKEGSPSHKLFQSKGKAPALTAKLPAQPFLFAGATDVSSPGVKQLMKDAAAMNPVVEGFGMVKTFYENLDKVDGIAFSIGATPQLMGGGLFANSMAYMATSDGAGVITRMKTTVEEMNGKTIQGTTFATTYKPGAVDAGGVKADEWSMNMQVDPNSPMAMQMQQIQMMLWGMGGGPSGYIAPAQGGVIYTLSKNQKLLTDSLAAAKGQAAADGDALLKEVAANLPPDRTFEAYIGTKSIMDTAVQFMAMMGGGANVKVPDQLAPVGIGGTTDSGGVQTRTYLPASVIKAVVDLGNSMKAPQAEEGPADNKKPPRF